MIIKSKYEYQPADNSVLYHVSDAALKPIRLSLPRPPRVDLIDGYGDNPEDQVFQRSVMPAKLQRLEEIALENLKTKAETDKAYTMTAYKLQREFWDELEDKQNYYRDEISWIKKTWWHIINGYWFYNNGKPTYITGWHYRYLNFWYINGVGYPDFRDRDMKEYIFFNYAYTTTETFADLDKNGLAIPESDGSYRMKDLGKRICYGAGQNKNRRSGNTNKGLNMVYAVTSLTTGTDGGGIMSYTADNAKSHFEKKMLPAWRKMPIFLKPVTSSNNSPKSIIHKAPANELGVKSLENAISYAETAEPKFYDGMKLAAVLIDESGKVTTLDVRKRHDVIQQCLSQGNGEIIHGWEYQPSTAEDLTAGGMEFKGLLEDSNFYKRMHSTGQTRSGLFRLFMPADEGLDGYIDKYGMSVRGKLTEDHIFKGYSQTATEKLQGVRNQLLIESKHDPDAMRKLREERKLFPLCYDDSWIGEAGEIGFDVEVIDLRLAELSRKPKTKRGNFAWIGSRFQGGAKFIEDELNGRFNISLELDDSQSNKFTKDSYQDPDTGEDIPTWTPLHPERFTAGADPFKYKTKVQATIGDGHRKKSTGRLSDGGGAVFWHRDFNVDPEDKDIKEWESNRLVCTYRFRTSDNIEYTEDMLLMCIYYGAMMFPEINVDIVYQKFVEWGYAGYLKHQVDIHGKIKDKPGITSLEGSKQEIFNELRNYIAKHGHRECHDTFLNEAKNIRGMEEMTRYDELTAVGCALVGAKSRYHEFLQEADNNEYSPLDIFN